MIDPLAGLSILVLEDEYLIAMDVEQLCLDHGASGVTISRTVDELGPDPLTTLEFDAAILDMRLGGASTLPFGAKLLAAGRPFVFATGYSDTAEIMNDFPGVEIVNKPYNGTDLIGALHRAVRRNGAGAGSIS